MDCSDRWFVLQGWSRQDQSRCREKPVQVGTPLDRRLYPRRCLVQAGWHTQTLDWVKLFFQRARHAARAPLPRESLQRIPQFLRRLMRVVLLSNCPYDRIHLRIWRAAVGKSQPDA